VPEQQYAPNTIPTDTLDVDPVNDQDELSVVDDTLRIRR